MAPHAPVQFVLMPWAAVVRPSIGLSLLKARLSEAGVQSTIRYSNLRFVSEVGFDANALVERAHAHSFLGDWVFGERAFPGWKPEIPGKDQDLEVSGHQPTDWYLKDPERYEEVLWMLRRQAGRFVTREAEQILENDPQIVGCSSTFQQHVPSLALLREIKRLAPAVTTIIGGANCEMGMGLTTLKEFKWIDFVASGEADDTIVPFCQAVLKGEGEIPVDEVPLGILGQAHLEAGTYDLKGSLIPRGTVADLDTLPTPDYSDFFHELEDCSAGAHIQPGLLAETSRGCWWGAVSHCTFCGLNGDSMTYRSKKPEKVLAEFHQLSEDWKINGIEVVDNIIDNKYLKTVLPVLEKEGAPFFLFYETKANLRREQVAQMARGGIRFIQPGIESLHDSLLSLMAKGTSATGNIQLLKYAREYGLGVSWSLLAGFPGEEDEWHDSVADMVPRLEHLSPPSTVFQVRYDRFSPYHSSPARYGIDLIPFEGYQRVYPISSSGIENLAYFFTDRNQVNRIRDLPGGRRLIEAAQLWKYHFYRGIPSILSMVDKPDGIEFFDTRQCATQRRLQIDGLEAEIHRLCDPARAEKSLPKLVNRARVENENPEPASDEAVSEALKQLDQKNLIVRAHGKVLSLAVPGEVPELLPISLTTGAYRGIPEKEDLLSAVRSHLQDLNREFDSVGVT